MPVQFTPPTPRHAGRGRPSWEPSDDLLREYVAILKLGGVAGSAEGWAMDDDEFSSQSAAQRRGRKLREALQSRASKEIGGAEIIIRALAFDPETSELVERPEPGVRYIWRCCIAKKGTPTA